LKKNIVFMGYEREDYNWTMIKRRQHYMLCAEVSIYPQKTTNASQVITNSIDSLANQNVNYKVGSLSTHIDGNDEQVWNGIKTLFDQAKNSGEVSMVLTVSNSAH
ncbi:MAG TPA: YkoF family thiamine/hydroxymethylpyrimidine-binding protein, partial [Verrucomicrobiae bacterium]|nr:YkoF family thiamine/hydroxymethylpyrimidine-binding protein [Verrucomicrobiae bacterium]